jgi:hypothetical protein
MIQPVGLGLYNGVYAYRIEEEDRFYFSFVFAIYFKVENDWKPPGNISIHIRIELPAPRIIGRTWIPYAPDL